MPLTRMPPVRAIAGLVISPRLVVAQRRGNRKRIMPLDVYTDPSAEQYAPKRDNIDSWVSKMGRKIRRAYLAECGFVMGCRPRTRSASARYPGM
jgi:hypothetical protein